MFVALLLSGVPPKPVNHGNPWPVGAGVRLPTRPSGLLDGPNGPLLTGFAAAM
jgi:hypothetical protein